jgi:hypothetical protein
MDEPLVYTKKEYNDIIRKTRPLIIKLLKIASHDENCRILGDGFLTCNCAFNRIVTSAEDVIEELDLILPRGLISN